MQGARRRRTIKETSIHVKASIKIFYLAMGQQMKSAFSGIIREIPFILVDNFENRDKTAYFLSHFHGDHIFGLKDSRLPKHLEESEGFIYASAVTVAIVENNFPALSPFLRVLELGRNTITIKQDGREIYLNVITLPAGHSLGSVMFLFQYDKTILYTGDFRISQNTVRTFSHLHKNGEPIHIDAMYVDTTFQDVPSFPKRSEVVRNIVVHVRDWLNLNKEHRVVFKTSACFGYEYVCNEVYFATGIKTYIDAKNWNIFRKFSKEIYGITNDITSRVHLYQKRTFITDSPKILSIYFSAWLWRETVHEENFIRKIKNNKMEACFATHCGRDELLYFIKYFNPKRVVGFPKPYDENASPVKLESYSQTSESPLQFKISPRLKRTRSNTESENLGVGKKITKHVLKKLFEW